MLWKLFLRRCTERSEVRGPMVALRWDVPRAPCGPKSTSAVALPRAKNNRVQERGGTMKSVIHLYPGLLWPRRAFLCSGTITSRLHEGKVKKKKKKSESSVEEKVPKAGGSQRASVHSNDLGPCQSHLEFAALDNLQREREPGNVLELPVNIQSALPWRW